MGAFTGCVAQFHSLSFPQELEVTFLRLQPWKAEQMKPSFSAGFDSALGPFKRVFLDFKKLLEMRCSKSICGGGMFAGQKRP